MVDCSHCDATFDDEQDYHRHLREHEEELNSHEEEQLKKAERAAEREQASEREQTQHRRRRIMVGAAAVLLVAVGAVAASQVVDFDTSSGPTGPVAFNLTGQPVLGDADAPVTVVEFGDYRCPYCQQFDQQMKPWLKEHYIDDGTVKFVFLNYPFLGQGSQQAAVAGECVYEQDPDGYWDFHTALYAAQGPESQRWVSTDLLTRLARDNTDVDMQQFGQCLSNAETADAVEHDLSIGQQAGVSGTPAVYVDGEHIKRWSPDNMQSAIEAALN